MAGVSVVKFLSDGCHWTLLIRQWIGAVRHQAITWANVDPDFMSPYGVTRPQWFTVQTSKMVYRWTTLISSIYQKGHLVRLWNQFFMYMTYRIAFFLNHIIKNHLQISRITTVCSTCGQENRDITKFPITDCWWAMVSVSQWQVMRKVWPCHLHVIRYFVSHECASNLNYFSRTHT